MGQPTPKADPKTNIPAKIAGKASYRQPCQRRESVPACKYQQMAVKIHGYASIDEGAKNKRDARN